MTARRPPALARAAWALAGLALPSAARTRYRAEWLAEAHAPPPRDQLRHAAGNLAGAPALSAVRRTVPEEDAMPVLAARGPFWRCRVSRWHEFVRRSTPDGALYQACRRCDLDRGPVANGPQTTPPYPVGSVGV